VNTALVIVDVQADFCSGGALAVADADAVIPVVNTLIAGFRLVFFTQDWHPRGHVSFASSHPGKDPFSHRGRLPRHRHGRVAGGRVGPDGTGRRSPEQERNNPFTRP
jgi:nicotinamidase-related amidase